VTEETPICVDLRERFGDRLKVEYEEGHRAEYGPRARTDDPWLQVVPSRNGDIYPHGGDELAAYCERPGIGKRLAALDCVRVHQHGDREITVVFDVADFDRVAAVLKPRKRRRLSPEQRAASAERLKRFAFTGTQPSAISGA